MKPMRLINTEQPGDSLVFCSYEFLPAA
jgi:hypothetical protein